MTLLYIKTQLGKVWLWIKMYWGWIVLGFLLLGALVYGTKKGKQYYDLHKAFEDQANDYRKQYRDLQAAYDQERQRHQQIEVTYRETLARIAAENQEALKNLDKTKQTELRAIVEATHDDPDLMSSRINDLFGIPVIR